ncbi:MAG: acetate kinase [Oscillospiraceae bacterium]|jgi:acetate kinase|nr:acetate kinase [Oscillospiraceae bacterium]
MKKILVVNAGSSSLKYQLFDMENETVMAKGLCERIGIGGRVIHHAGNHPAHEADRPMAHHGEAIRVLTELLTSPQFGCIADMSEIAAVGHRIVHGGDLFNKSVRIDPGVIAAIESCVPLAPLHNPGHLVGIRACIAELGEAIPQVAVFDTAFHQTMPEHAYIYALPYEYYEKHKVRRYGFHGTSHGYVSARAAQILGKPLTELKIITCHMGNGSSLCAVDGGKSVDTSMGFTPLDGVPMGTRSGALDPAILTYIAEHEGLTFAQISEMLNKKSGVLGISGISSDFRDLHAADANGDARAKLALRHFAHCVKKYIGAFAAVMGGCDALVFTAGIGENNRLMRLWVCEGLEYMGLVIDPQKNDTSAEAVVSAPGSRGSILVVPTNEELVIARDTLALTR